MKDTEHVGDTTIFCDLRTSKNIKQLLFFCYVYRLVEPLRRGLKTFDMLMYVF